MASSFFLAAGLLKIDRAQFLAVESLVGLQNFGAECFNNFFPGIATGLDHLARQRIGIDDGGAETPQDFRNRAFSRGDAAG